jgi:glycosyltransferase involved in cell wall biosynthesis
VTPERETGGAGAIGARPVRVAIDATSLLDRPTGVGVFVRAVLDGLADRDDLDVSTFAVSWRGRDRLPAVVPPGIAVRSRPVPARLARPLWARGEHPSARWLGGACDLVHGPNHVVPPGGGAAELVTVHDLTAVRFPEMCNADVLQWPPLLDRSIARGAWVHTDTDAVGDEVRERWPAVAERVVTVRPGVDVPDPAAVEAARGLGRRLAGGDRYVLALGTVEPRKDLPGLVAAFDELAATDPDVRLVVAGPDGWGVDEFLTAWHGARHRGRIVRLGWVSSEQRLGLLADAAVLAYPSRYEGFGFVPLEALAVGTPVVATAVPAVVEVTGDAGLLVPSGDPSALAAALVEVLAGGPAVEARTALGAKRVGELRWDCCTDELAALYHRIVDAG